MSIVVAILIFGLIILIHELGHYLFARKAGILVEEFAIGMGPKLIGKQVGDTLFSIRIIPFGGYCKMLGEDGTESEDNVEDERSFSQKSVWARFQVLFGGPLFNFILAFVFAILSIALVGGSTTVVSEVIEGYPAYEAGIQAGDKIVGYNDKTIIHSSEFRTYMGVEKPETLEVTVKRDGEKISYTLSPKLNENGQLLIGITFTNINKGNAFEVIKSAGIEIVFWIKMVFYSLGSLISGDISADEISGPIGIVSVISSGYNESVEYGIKSVIATLSFYIVLLSANLGVMNLLPLPALDGGRLVFIAIEAVRGKPIDPKKEGYVHFVGFVLLMALMVLVVFKDVSKLF